jgi:hypothetical protein
MLCAKVDFKTRRGNLIWRYWRAGVTLFGNRIDRRLHTHLCTRVFAISPAWESTENTLPCGGIGSLSLRPSMCSVYPEFNEKKDPQFCRRLSLGWKPS